jgi:glycosyltransferase involved in cell wall biosynthesis
MPVYNRVTTVLRAIDSVRAQTFADFELIVVDDGSTDGSAELIASVADPRLILLRLGSNKGGNAARNEGLRRARGDIISFLDSDDIFLPRKLEIIAAHFAARPDLEGIIDSFRKTSPDKGERDCLNPLLDDSDQIMRALFDRRIWKSTSAISVRRQAALRAGLFDESLRRRQDFDFLVRLIGAAKFATVATITWVKTSTPDRISASLSSFLPGFLDFWNRHPQYYDDPDFRAGFAADLTRHYAKLIGARRLDLLARDIALVRRKIGWFGIIRSMVVGIRELRRLKRHRRSLGGNWRYRPEGRKRLEATCDRAPELTGQQDGKIAKRDE